MEFTKSQIAALVLGYLKSEKLAVVIREFLKSSPYLKENNRGIRNGKYFVTRFGDLSLVDILHQYALICTMVQGRLEETNFYEIHTPNSTTLIDKLLYLLDKEIPPCKTSTPTRSTTSEVEATSSEELPGNAPNEDDSSIQKTPKRKTSKCEGYDVSDILSSFLESHELHEKIAENINIVRNTPEVTKASVPDEHISAGASREIDAVIRTALQKTEEDPVYNKLLDEIVGTVPAENTLTKKLSTPSEEPMETSPSSTSTDDASKSKNEATDKNQSNKVTETIEDHNNDAIRSIIEAVQNTAPPQDPPTLETISSKNQNGEVYVFDGTLDSYLKSAGAANVMNNSLYINPGGVIVMPPPEKQYYIVNNQPLINMNVKTPILTEKDFMSIPTVIVNDPPTTTQTSFLAITATTTKKTNKRNKTLRAKATTTTTVSISSMTTESGSLLTTTPKMNKTIPTTSAETVVVTASQTTPSVGVSLPQVTPSSVSQPTSMVVTRQASHVRNLDFSTPAGKAPPKKEKKTWDEDLRMLLGQGKDKSPSPKRKRPVSTKKKKVKRKSVNEDDEKENEIVDEKNEVDEKKDEEEEKKNKSCEDDIVSVVAEEKEMAASQTPIKDIIPKTPGGCLISGNTSIHCTPFNDVLEEHLKGVDLTAIPTPSIPITPGFVLTPGGLVGYNQRSTDYSTSSSYYQPSDTEQNRSIDQLIEECKKLDDDKTPQDKFKDLKILSDVVINHGEEKNEIKKNDIVKKPNSAPIPKKNLNLMKRHITTSSSSSDSDSDFEIIEELNNKTVICKTDNETKPPAPSTISDIINKVKVKNTLDSDKEPKKTKLLSDLEAIRQRTIQKIKIAEIPKKTVKICKPPPLKKPVKISERKNSKIKEASLVDEKKTTKKSSRKKETVKDENKVKETRKSSRKKEPSVSETTRKNTKKNDSSSNKNKSESIPKKNPPKKSENDSAVLTTTAKNLKKKETDKVEEPTETKSESKKETIIDENSLKLVTDLAQRGIHLVPNTNKKPKEKTPPVEKETVEENLSNFERKTFEDFEVVVNDSTNTQEKELTSYNFDLLKKSASITVFDEDLNREVTSILKWTQFGSVLELESTLSQKVTKTDQEIEEDLMNLVFMGSLSDGTKGNKKRKFKGSEDEGKQTEKKSKIYESNIKLLKRIDVDEFLDKVHGE